MEDRADEKAEHYLLLRLVVLGPSLSATPRLALDGALGSKLVAVPSKGTYAKCQMACMPTVPIDAMKFHSVVGVIVLDS